MPSTRLSSTPAGGTTPVALRPCLDCQTPCQRTRCTNCQRTRDQQRWTTKAERYGTEHRKARADWAPAVAAGIVTCSRADHLINPAEPWDMDHINGQDIPACAYHNRQAGGAASRR